MVHAGTPMIAKEAGLPRRRKLFEHHREEPLRLAALADNGIYAFYEFHDENISLSYSSKSSLPRRRDEAPVKG
jgi:hypothetical protein